MNTIFKSLDEFQEEFSNVYNFFETCYDTIVSYLKEHGDVELTDEEKDEWIFSFLDKDGTFEVQALRLDEHGDFYLDTLDKYADKVPFYVDSINHDFVITEMIMDKIFDLKNKEL